MANHSHSNSDSSSGSSYQLILDHIFTYPGTYELPLRTMYTLNSAPRAQPLRSYSPASSASASPVNGHPGFDGQEATQVFVDNVVAQMQQMSTQPCSLPPSFITQFLRRCFPTELIYVDFPQALTGIDYLKDLESRRRKEVQQAMARLGVQKTTLQQADAQLRARYPAIIPWLDSIKQKEEKIDSMYSQLYVALRRWILINELKLMPFNKHNCMAMLNSLYPPMGLAHQPTSKLTSTVLKKQREGFFKYIQAVERDGNGVLSTIMRQGAVGNEKTGWPAVTRYLTSYLHLANSMITECSGIVDVTDVLPEQPAGRHRGKVDSGVSLPLHEKRPSTASSVTSDAVPAETRAVAAAEVQRPKTPSSRGGSALEKLARGLRSMGMSKLDVTEMLPEEELITRTSPTKTKSLRKMRSLGNIGERKSANSASALDRAAPAFDADEMRRQRMRFEAANVHQQKFGTAISHEI